MDLNVNQARVETELAHLATFSSAPVGAVTRILYSQEDMAARAYLKSLAEEAGLSVRTDALGNTFYRWGTPDAPAVATGSHIDAIPHSGRYDGTVGVLGGLEAIRALKASGFAPKRPIELVLFTTEEPTRFGVGCLGSRALARTLSPEKICNLKDEEGKNPDEARKEVGFEGRLEDVALPKGYYHAFVELHIEQGPVLEQKNISIGVVTAIAAPATLHLTLTGEGGHAGAVLMPGRKDALVAGAEIVQAVERAAVESGNPDTVATVGIFDVYPRAVNSIPSKVFMTVDVRDTDLERRDAVVSEIREAIVSMSSQRGVEAQVDIINADPPATCDLGIVGATEAAAGEVGLETLRMVSRAYHDTLFMARVCPVGMIFIPCKNGVSHRPDEYSAPEDIERGIQVLAVTLAKLAG